MTCPKTYLSKEADCPQGSPVGANIGIHLKANRALAASVEFLIEAANCRASRCVQRIRLENINAVDICRS